MPGPLIALAWAGGLVAVVIVAVIGTGTSPSRTTPVQPVPSLAVAPVTAAPVVADARPVLQIVSPDVVGAVITTPRLNVRGSRGGPSGPIRVTLESSGSKLVASETIPANGAGGAFHVAFPLSNPRPGGSMVVQVVAFDPHGIPLEVVRIPVEIGAIADGTPRNVGRTGEGTRGEDGILGGIVFGTAWDPDAVVEGMWP